MWSRGSFGEIWCHFLCYLYWWWTRSGSGNGFRLARVPPTCLILFSNTLWLLATFKDKSRLSTYCACVYVQQVQECAPLSSLLALAALSKDFPRQRKHWLAALESWVEVNVQKFWLQSSNMWMMERNEWRPIWRTLSKFSSREKIVIIN